MPFLSTLHSPPSTLPSNLDSRLIECLRPAHDPIVRRLRRERKRRSSLVDLWRSGVADEEYQVIQILLEPSAVPTGLELRPAGALERAGQRCGQGEVEDAQLRRHLADVEGNQGHQLLPRRRRSTPGPRPGITRSRSTPPRRTAVRGGFRSRKQEVSPIHLLHGKVSPIHLLHRKVSPIHLLHRKVSPIHLLHGMVSPIHLRRRESVGATRCSRSPRFQARSSGG